MSVTGKNWVGNTASSLGERIFFAINPAENSKISTPFYQATASEIEAAVDLSAAAFLVYARISIGERVAFLRGISEEIKQNSTELIQAFCLETGLPKNRAESELNRSCLQFESYAEAVQNGYALEIKIDSGNSERSPNPKPDLRKMNVPLGPVVVFGASNFPFAYSTLGGDVASALAAGCPVIVKAHAMHPHTSELSAQLILSVAKRLNLPDGVFAHLNGIDYEVGEALVKHPMVKAVGFTGSIKGGMALHTLAQNRPEPIPVFAEMGSSNPILITAKALRARTEEISLMIAHSVLLNAGQFCTSPGIVFVEESEELAAFIHNIQEAFRQSEPQVMLHPGIFEAYVKRAQQQIDATSIVFDGSRAENRIQPSLVLTSDLDFLANDSIAEEVFGSFLTIVMCKSEKSALECFQSCQGQLTASLFAEETENVAELVFQLSLKAGRVIMNGVPTGVEVSYAMQHGGPFPSSNQTDSSVGWDAVKRFLRPVSFQNVTEANLPDSLKTHNPSDILRFVNGIYQQSIDSDR